MQSNGKKKEVKLGRLVAYIGFLFVYFPFGINAAPREDPVYKKLY
jgi:hypothetical protein